MIPMTVTDFLFNLNSCSRRTSNTIIRELVSRRKKSDEQDLEEQCEEAVFKVCDARERYPSRCAEELDKYLCLKNDIAMKPVILKEIPQHFEIPSRVDTGRTGTPEKVDSVCNTWSERAKELQNMTNKIQELKVVLKQIEDNKNFVLKHHLQ